MSAPKTFLNAHTCVVGRESCASRRYTSAMFTLNAGILLQFYRRAGLYVYIISGLRHDAGELPPCAGVQSRWIRREVEPALCNDQLDASTRDAIGAALDDGIAHDNEVIRDITINSDAVGCSAPVGASVQNIRGKATASTGKPFVGQEPIGSTKTLMLCAPTEARSEVLHPIF